MHNANQPKDETLPPYELQMLELAVQPIARALRMLGHDPAPADDEDTTVSTTGRTNRYFGVTLHDLVQAGYVAGGAQLTSTYGVWPATATIVDGGSVQYNGETYPTPSKAACAVKDGGAANGRDFWGVVGANGATKLAVLREQYLKERK